MPSGEAFTDSQTRDVSRATASATAQSGLHFSVYVGGVEGEVRQYAERLHGALGPSSAAGVLVFVSPTDRALEIVTGPVAARRLSDRSCALAALSMTTSFTGGDLAGGLVSGLRMLTEAAGRELASG